MIDGGTCDGSCNPNTAEWVELYNTCSTSVDVGCYILADGDWTYVIPEGTTIDANGFLTIGGASQEDTAPDLYWDNATGSYIGTFTNSAEQLALFDNSGNWEDGIVWGGGQNLADNSNPVATSGNCTITNVNLPKANNSNWEDIVTDGVNISSMARSVDGGSTGENRVDGGLTYGFTNGNTELPLPYIVTNPQNYKDDEDEELIEIGIWTLDLRKCERPLPSGVYFIRYSNYKIKKILIK
jgi:hypothetical protein